MKYLQLALSLLILAGVAALMIGHTILGHMTPAGWVIGVFFLILAIEFVQLSIKALKEN